MGAVETGWNVDPPCPQVLPARWPAPFAPQVAAIAGNGVPTALGGQLGGWQLGQGGDALHEVRRQDLARQLLGTLPRRRPQLQQPYRCGSQQSQQAAQALVSLQLALLHPTARFQPLMKGL